jgi:hypothetical protein
MKYPALQREDVEILVVSDLTFELSSIHARRIGCPDSWRWRSRVYVLNKTERYAAVETVAR